MAFTPPTGTRRRVSAKTREDIERRNLMLQLVDRSDEGEFRAGTERLFMQRREWNSTTPSNVDRAAANKNRAWAATTYLTASEITVSLRFGEELGVEIPRLDERQSPIQEIERARRKIAASINNEIEANMVSFFNGLTSKANPAAADNGNAGSVSKVTLGNGGSNFISRAAPYSYTKGTAVGAYDADEIIMDGVIDDFILWAKRNNLIDGTAVYGSMPSRLYMVMHPELVQRYLIKVLREAGFSLDPLTTSTLRNTSAFSGEAFTASLGLMNFTVYSPTSLTVPTSPGNWRFWGGYTEAVVGGIGAMLTQIISPQENQIGDGWVVRQVVNPYYNLLSGDGIRQYEIHAD